MEHMRQSRKPSVVVYELLKQSSIIIGLINCRTQLSGG